MGPVADINLTTTQAKSFDAALGLEGVCWSTTLMVYNIKNPFEDFKRNEAHARQTGPREVDVGKALIPFSSYRR